MRKRLVYFSLSLAAALAALVTQVSPPPAVAQRASPIDPSAECVECEETCDVIYQACTAERGSRGPGHGLCVRERQECRQSCNGRGGPCHPQAGAGTDPAPTPTPTPTPTPD